MITFTIPGAPYGKGRPIVGRTFGGHVRLRTPEKTVAYEGLIAHEARIAMAGRPLLDCAVSVHLAIRCAVPASWSKRKQAEALAGRIIPTIKPDADNVIKAVCDGCNGVVWRDDVLAADGGWSRRYAAVPGVTVTIAPIVVEVA
ncbi:MAG: RusA family crossover junction endodeoxyribonuclease [Pseudomonadota bacterium]